MWMIVATLMIGFLIGRFGLIPERFRGYTHWITMGGLIFLLIAMGASLSSNQEVLAKVRQLGFQSLALAIAGIVGSVFCVWILQQTLFRQRKGGQVE
jgi:hypothetical protein